MNVELRIWTLAVLLVVAVACGESGDGASPDGGGDGADAVLGDVDLGDGKTDTVADSVALTVGVPADGAIVTRAEPGYRGPKNPFVEIFHWQAEAGATYAFLLEGTDPGEGELDPHVILSGAEKSVLAEGRDQALIPSASPDDALVAVTSDRDQIIYAIGYSEDFDATGGVRARVLELAGPPKLGIDRTSPGRRAYRDVFAELEDEVAAWVAAGVLVEGPEGYLVTTDRVADVELRQRADVNRIEATVNSHREDLFEYIADDEGGNVTDIGATLGDLWQAMRASESAN